MVTVVKTITEHTNGRRQRPDGTWEERTGTRPKPNSKRGLVETIWEPCAAPKTYDYGSRLHHEARERGMRGGVVKWEIGGIEEGTYDLDEVEAEILLRYYVKEFEAFIWSTNPGYYHQGREQVHPDEAARQALRVAKRVHALFGIDLYETNAGAS